MVSNFFRAFILSMLSISISNAKIPQVSDRLRNKIESITQEISEFLVCENWGQFPLSQENEAFVRSIIDEIGINRKIVIRKFSNTMLQAGASKNAVTVDLGVIIYIYFDEEYFNTLSKEEKKFIVAHEACHAKRLHVPLISIAIGVAVPVLVKLANKHVFNGQLDRKIFPMRYTFENKFLPELSMSGYLQLQLSLIASVFLISKISKLAEFDADLNAVRSLADADGGISLFERIISEHDSESRFRIKRIFNRMICQIRTFFTSHPTNEQRIDVLKKFEEDNDASLLKLLMRHYYDTLKKGCSNFSANVKLAVA